MENINKDFYPKCWRLEISSFLGSIGAEHYYGNLICGDWKEKIELKRVIDLKEAKYLDKKDGSRKLMERMIKEGYKVETIRFRTIKELEKKAVEIVKEKGVELLIVSNDASMEAKKILFNIDGCDVSGLNKMAKEIQKINTNTDKRWELYEKYNNEYFELFYKLFDL